MATLPFAAIRTIRQTSGGSAPKVWRSPRLVLEGEERREALALIADRLGSRPAL
jgi:hypothetical protein